MFPSYILTTKRPCPHSEQRSAIHSPLLGRKISPSLWQTPAYSGIQKPTPEASYSHVHKICASPVDIHVDDGPTSITGTIATSVPIV